MTTDARGKSRTDRGKTLLEEKKTKEGQQGERRKTGGKQERKGALLKNGQREGNIKN